MTWKIPTATGEYAWIGKMPKRGAIRVEAGSLSYMAMTANSESSNRTLLDCIDDAMKAILGEQVLESLDSNPSQETRFHVT
jgi:hypothetical protein